MCNRHLLSPGAGPIPHAIYGQAGKVLQDLSPPRLVLPIPPFFFSASRVRMEFVTKRLRVLKQACKTEFGRLRDQLPDFQVGNMRAIKVEI
jgi:hypothetical protein